MELKPSSAEPRLPLADQPKLVSSPFPAEISTDGEFSPSLTALHNHVLVSLIFIFPLAASSCQFLHFFWATAMC